MTTIPLCEFPILFSTVKLKLRDKSSRFINKFKIWILKCWPCDVYTSMFSWIHEGNQTLAFLNSLGCTSKFSQLTKQFENCHFRSPLAFKEWIVGQDESIYDLIASFQQKIFKYYNEGNNFVSVFALKMLFSNIN